MTPHRSDDSATHERTTMTTTETTQTLASCAPD